MLVNLYLSVSYAYLFWFSISLPLRLIALFVACVVKLKHCCYLTFYSHANGSVAATVITAHK